MIWNYRLLQDRHGTVMVHEVYYHNDKTVCSWTRGPTEFGGENKEEAIRALQMALDDVTNYDVLIEAELEEDVNSHDCPERAYDTWEDEGGQNGSSDLTT